MQSFLLLVAVNHRINLRDTFPEKQHILLDFVSQIMYNVIVLIHNLQEDLKIKYFIGGFK